MVGFHRNVQVRSVFLPVTPPPPFHDPSPQKTRALSPAFSCSSVSVLVSQHTGMEVCNSCSSHTEAKAKVKHHSTHPPKGEEPRLTTVRRAVDTCTLVSSGDCRGSKGREASHRSSATNTASCCLFAGFALLSLALFLAEPCPSSRHFSENVRTRLAIFGFGAIYKTCSQFELSPKHHRMSLIFPLCIVSKAIGE